MKKETDSPAIVSRYDPRQVPDFSFADGANVEAVKPGKRKRARIKTTIENAKPEL